MAKYRIVTGGRFKNKYGIQRKWFLWWQTLCHHDVFRFWPDAFNIFYDSRAAKNYLKKYTDSIENQEKSQKTIEEIEY